MLPALAHHKHTRLIVGFTESKISTHLIFTLLYSYDLQLYIRRWSYHPAKRFNCKSSRSFSYSMAMSSPVFGRGRTTQLFCEYWTSARRLLYSSSNLHSFAPSSRYLRAQKLDTVLAFGQFHFAQTWRKEHHIREFYEEVEVSFYENSRRMVRNPSSLNPS